MDILFGSSFGGVKKFLKIAGTDIYAGGQYKDEHIPYLSFTFSREQLIQMREIIDAELKNVE